MDGDGDSSRESREVEASISVDVVGTITRMSGDYVDRIIVELY